MAKLARSRKKPGPKPEPGPGRLRYLPAFVVGLLLLVAAAFFWQQSVNQAFSDRLVRKLPADSTTVALTRFSAQDQDSLRQVTAATGKQGANTAALLDALSRAGVSPQTIRQVLDDEFGFADTPRGSLAVFSLRDERRLADLTGPLGEQLVERQEVDDEGVRIITGKLKETGLSLAAARWENQLFLAATPDLIKAARRETGGFASVPRVADLAKQLPPGRDGYLFFQPAVAKASLGHDFPMLGAAWTNERDTIELTARVAEPKPPSVRLAQTAGKLLPPPDQATAAIQGADLGAYLNLLEEQRASTDLPKVLSLQNGLTSLSRTLGVDVQQQYLEGRPFVYARFLSPQGTAEWMAALEYESLEQATATTTELTKLLQEKLTIPTRKEVVQILPDGSQSREIVSEGRQPPAFTEFDIEGRKGQAVPLPGNFGTAHFIVSDRYLVLASTPEGITRMNRSLAKPVAAGRDGEQAVRLTVKDAARLLGTQHVFAEWTLAARPTSGRFTLTKASGELTGTVNFRN